MIDAADDQAGVLEWGGDAGEVASALKAAKDAGAKILKPAQDVFWRGHSGYFADLDGHPWEVAWNPHFRLNKRGEIELP
jgi:uncharacterized glyoxalase superfamily protein PhnB